MLKELETFAESLNGHPIATSLTITTLCLAFGASGIVQPKNRQSLSTIIPFQERTRAQLTDCLDELWIGVEELCSGDITPKKLPQIEQCLIKAFETPKKMLPRHFPMHALARHVRENCKKNMRWNHLR